VKVGLKPRPASPNQEVLAGLIERVTFHNAENGFCVLRVKPRGHRDPVTVVGHAASISAGEWVTAGGEWVNDRTHGQQFKTRFLRISAPTTTEGIEKYLGSGMIRGIGPVYAGKLVKAFGAELFDVIEAEPDRLREVTGIGPMRANRITDAWAEQKIVREIMVFLHSHGVGTARVIRIFKTDGADAVQVMTDNPYRLARDIRGIGFKTADAIAMKLGIDKAAMIRVRAGISYALAEVMDDGHCGLPIEELVPLATGLLGFLQSWYRPRSISNWPRARLSRTHRAKRPVHSSPACIGPSGSSRSGYAVWPMAGYRGPISICGKRCRGLSRRPDYNWPRVRQARSGRRCSPRFSSSPVGRASARPPSSIRFCGSWQPRLSACRFVPRPGEPRSA
jgi:Holliday junction resolvasome RuvABC DNA-binding subunit